MSSRPLHLAIDARPRGPRGLLAAEVVLGRTMLGHLADLAAGAGARRASRWPCTRGPRSTASCASWSASGPGPGSSSSPARRGPTPPCCGPIAIYDRSRLRRRLRRGGSPESAVLWRLDRPEALLLGRRGADPAADLSAARQVLGVPPGGTAGRTAPPDAGPAQRGDPGLGGPDARGGRAASPSARPARRRPRGDRRWPWRWPWCSTPPTAAWPGCRGRARHSAAGSTSSSTSWPTWSCTPRSPGPRSPATAGRSGCCSASFTRPGSICSACSRAWAMSWSTATSRAPIRPIAASRRPSRRADSPGSCACSGMPTCAGISGSSWPRCGRLDVALAAYAVYFPVRTLAGGDQEGGRHA